MFSLKHLFHSPKADGTDPTLCKPSDWNADHTITASTDGVVIGRAIGAGPGAMDEIPISNIGSPAGAIVAFGGGTAPAGWLMCNAGVYNRSDFPNLFAVIGVTYNLGGETSAQFRVPDLRGRVVAGPDGGTGRISSYVGGGLGNAGGGQTAQSLIGAHLRIQGYVTGRATPVEGEGYWLYGYYSGGLAAAGAGAGAGSDFVKAGNTYIVNSGSLKIDYPNTSIYNDGSNIVSTTVPLVQPTMTLNYIIKT